MIIITSQSKCLLFFTVTSADPITQTPSSHESDIATFLIYLKILPMRASSDLIWDFWFCFCLGHNTSWLRYFMLLLGALSAGAAVSWDRVVWAEWRPLLNTLTSLCFILGGIIYYSLMSFHTPASQKAFAKRSFSTLTERDRKALQL